MKRKSFKKKPEKDKSQTDLIRLHRMKDEDIDFSDIPEISDEMLDKAEVIFPAHEIRLTSTCNCPQAQVEPHSFIFGKSIPNSTKQFYVDPSIPSLTPWRMTEPYSVSKQS